MHQARFSHAFCPPVKQSHMSTDTQVGYGLHDSQWETVPLWYSLGLAGSGKAAYDPLWSSILRHQSVFCQQEVLKIVREMTPSQSLWADLSPDGNLYHTVKSMNYSLTSLQDQPVTLCPISFIQRIASSYAFYCSSVLLYASIEVSFDGFATEGLLGVCEHAAAHWTGQGMISIPSLVLQSLAGSWILGPLQWHNQLTARPLLYFLVMCQTEWVFSRMCLQMSPFLIATRRQVAVSRICFFPFHSFECRPISG